MKKEATDDQILDMLTLGRSYSEIQEELGVSPNRISFVKKQFLSDIDRDDSLLSFQNSDDNSDDSDYNSENLANPPLDNTDYHSNNSNDNNNRSFPRSNSEIEVEKLRLQLKHEREMAKLQMEKEKYQDEIAQKNKELSLLEQRNQFQVEKEQQYLLKKFKKLLRSCIENEWTYDDSVELLEISRNLMGEIIPHCKGESHGDLFADEIRTLELLVDYLENEVDDWNDEDEEAYSFEFPQRLQLYIDHFI